MKVKRVEKNDTTPHPPISIPDADEIQSAIEIQFAPDQRALVAALIRTCNTCSQFETERRRTQMAVLVLCEGDLAKLQHFVGMAINDYRDVITWSSNTRPGLALRDELDRRIKESKRGK